VFRILLTRRWVALTLLFLALIPAMVWLGQWQFHRYEQSKASTRLTDANVRAAAVGVESLSSPGVVIPQREMYRHATATGHYDTAHEFVVRHRTDSSGDIIGFYVVTPLVLDDGKEILVNRGWISPGNTTGTEYPAVPAAPTGTVTLDGLFRPDETSALTGIRDVKGLPDRQFMLINSQEQARRTGETLLAGYLELNRTTPAPRGAQPETVPQPQDATGGMAVVGKGVHLPYAVQWWVFAALVPVAWWFLFRREWKASRTS
jgi:cytochrome oxidase assembly protein ShyY1